MQTDNTTENVLRFLQIRPAAPLDTPGGPTESTGQEARQPARRLERPPAGGSPATEAIETNPSATPSAVVDELVRLARPAYLDHDAGTEQRRGGGGYRLNDRGRGQLSGPALDLITQLSLDPAEDSFEALILALEGNANMAPTSPPSYPPPPPVPTEDLPYLRDVGVADLLVVKQHLKSYERTDIAHVENVLAGETKSRTHRRLDRSEETITLERETTQEKQTELETAERFELNREMARTVQRDQEFGFGLSISGKYGPTVDFASNLQTTSSTSTEESVRSATRYTKDVIERSLERVVERVREERVRKLLHEEEETNLHELTNPSSQHRAGVYQFLDKVYESQIFNYGIRQMFDFMVPEPASYLWHLEGSQADLNLPTPPPRLDAFVADFTAIDETNYPGLAARFSAEGIEPPPPVFVTAAASIVHGQDAPDDGEEGHPRSVLQQDLSTPEGYVPFRALVRPLALTDDSLAIAITVGHEQLVWIPGSGQIDVGEGHEIGAEPLELFLLAESTVYEPQSKLPVHAVAFETNSYSLAVEVVFLRSPEAYRRWQIKTYDRLSAAYADLQARYEATVADLKAAAQAEKANTTTRFGAPPSQNLKTIKAELKKHCISIVTRQRYEGFDAVQDGDPPYFDFEDAAELGSFTRFFEQAFEWDQLQYVCYPYFWSRGDRWADRFLRQDVDPTLLEFLQAGAARVVVPARPGFERAVSYYLETLRIWNDEGEPTVEDPQYLPIVTEIEERTGAPQGEIPVGEPWLTRVPTPLAIVRREETLPEWERTDPESWDWEEV